MAGAKKKEKSDLSVYYAERIAHHVNVYMKKNNIRQATFAASCNMGQAALSKLLKGSSTMTIEHICKFAEVMKVSPANLLNEAELSDLSDSLQESQREKDILVRDPRSFHFNGIKGEYFFYCKPTLSSEQNRFLKGRFVLSDAENMRGRYCKASLNLETGKFDENGQMICKHYEGEMIISTLMYSCTSMMWSKSYADFCCMNFVHSYLNDTPLQCRLVACLTTSAGIGTSRKPVMLKAIITRTELNDEDLRNLEGQFFMNTSEITLTKKAFENIMKEINFTAEEKSELERICRKETIYTWSESSIRNIRNTFESTNLINLINLMRRKSLSYPYIKISDKADGFLFDYIQNKKMSR